MKVVVALPEAELDTLYNGYTSDGGTRTRDEVAEVLAQDIIDRYFSPEYYDPYNFKSTVDDLLD